MDRNLAKDIHSLLRGIGKLSGGQASVCQWDPDDLSTFDVEIAPSGGPYKTGKFKFTFEFGDLYPEYAPQVICKTHIYHPNIDTVGSSFDNTNICVSTLDDWDESYTLEDLIQALLFLFHNPNTEDPLCPLISPDITDDEFYDNVELSLKGGEVEAIQFETNYGYLENNIVTDKNEESLLNVTEDESEKNIENSRTGQDLNINNIQSEKDLETDNNNHDESDTNSDVHLKSVAENNEALNNEENLNGKNETVVEDGQVNEREIVLDLRNKTITDDNFEEKRPSLLNMLKA